MLRFGIDAIMASKPIPVVYVVDIQETTHLQMLLRENLFPFNPLGHYNVFIAYSPDRAVTYTSLDSSSKRIYT